MKEPMTICAKDNDALPVIAAEKRVAPKMAIKLTKAIRVLQALFSFLRVLMIRS